MYCIIATEKPSQLNVPNPANIIINNLLKLPQFQGWHFEVCNDGNELLRSQVSPDVIVVSRFLTGENIEVFIKHLPLKHPSSRIILLTGVLNESARAFIKMCEGYGLTNIVTGKLPGERPYTLTVALMEDKEPVNHIDPTWLDSSVDSQENSLANKGDPQQENTLSDIVTDIMNQTKKFPEEIRAKRIIKLKVKPVTTNSSEIQVIDQNYPFYGYNNMNSRRKGVFCLTSANKGGVGKTTVAVTSAIALADAGVKVCLCDFDLGAPDIGAFFDLSKGLGIEYLTGKQLRQSYVEEIIVNVRKNLDVLPGPMNQTFPTFESGQLAELVNLLLNMYTVVIGDTSPEFWTKPWYNELFEKADRVITVVDQSKFSEHETKTYAPKLTLMGVTPEKIRIVLNKFSPKLHNAAVVEKCFSAGFKKGVPAKMKPKIAVTIPEDWNAHVAAGYKGQVVGLDDVYSQWHNLAKEIAELAGHRYNHAPEKKSKENLFKSLLSRFKK